MSGETVISPLRRRRLVAVWGQLGDFDSLEYAQAVVPLLPRLERAGGGGFLRPFELATIRLRNMAHLRAP